MVIKNQYGGFPYHLFTRLQHRAGEQGARGARHWLPRTNSARLIYEVSRYVTENHFGNIIVTEGICNYLYQAKVINDDNFVEYIGIRQGDF